MFPDVHNIKYLFYLQQLQNSCAIIDVLKLYFTLGVNWELSDMWTHCWAVYVTAQAALSIQAFCKHPQSLEKVKGKLFLFFSCCCSWLWFCHIFFPRHPILPLQCSHLFSSFISRLLFQMWSWKRKCDNQIPSCSWSALFGKMIYKMHNTGFLPATFFNTGISLY